MKMGFYERKDGVTHDGKERSRNSKKDFIIEVIRVQLDVWRRKRRVMVRWNYIVYEFRGAF